MNTKCNGLIATFIKLIGKIYAIELICGLIWAIGDAVNGWTDMGDDLEGGAFFVWIIIIGIAATLKFFICKLILNLMENVDIIAKNSNSYIEEMKHIREENSKIINSLKIIEKKIISDSPSEENSKE